MMLMPLARIATQTIAPADDIAVELLFDGKPLRTTATTACSCHDDNRNAWRSTKKGQPESPRASSSR